MTGSKPPTLCLTVQHPHHSATPSLPYVCCNAYSRVQELMGYGAVWHGAEWGGVAWSGAVRSDAVRCRVARRGVVRSDVV
ncbi:hypothetical protein Y032_0147g2576 [Ancylostoma ceylanicum]|uniref:Uncharacterized protein n=1 Tax=Ancylostoma ceylanicum TaxID=53326 RepID=A0A016T1V8_9BILA|nr:hypothetical protein Y032_0147g2576 [Ancylostoma ceylanicum]